MENRIAVELAKQLEAVNVVIEADSVENGVLEKEDEKKEENASANVVEEEVDKGGKDAENGGEEKGEVEEDCVQIPLVNMSFEIMIDRIVLERTIEIHNSKYF